jgi:hypothetical protein
MYRFISHIGAGDLYPSSGPQPPNDITSTNTISLAASIPPSFSPKTPFTWAGYLYRVVSVAFGKPTTAYNLRYDVPAYSFSAGSPILKMPEPLGSIEIVAENQGIAPGGSADQTLPSAGATNLQISIPVYDASKIGGDFSAFFQTVTPTNSQAFAENLLQLVAGQNNTIELPQGIFQLNASLVSYNYTNPSTGGGMGVVVPATGIAIQNPPKFSFSQEGEGSYFKDYPALAMRINDGTAGYSNGKMMLPNGGGATQIVSYSLATFTPGGEAFTEDGIPVVVTDKDGKAVKVVGEASETTMPLNMRLLQGLVGVIVVMGLLALFVMLPNGDSSMRSLGLVLVTFFLGLLPMILAGSSLGGLNMLPKSGGYTALMWLVIFVMGLVGVLGVGGLFLEIYSGELSAYINPGITISTLLMGAMFVLYVFILANGTTSADYDPRFKSTPLFLQSLSGIFKALIPLGIMAVFGLPLPLLNPMFLQGLASKEGFDARTTAIPTTETPKDIVGNINAMLRVATLPPDTFMDDAFGNSFGKTLSAIRPIQPGEKLMSKIPGDIIAIEKGDSIVVPLVKTLAPGSGGGGEGSVSGGVVGGGRSVPKVIGFHSLGTIRQNFPTKAGEPPKSLGSGVNYLKISDFTKGGGIEENVSFGYSLTLATTLAVVMGVSLIAPSLIGSTAYPGEGEKEKPTPTFAEQLTDSLLAIVPPVIVAYFVHASGIYRSFTPGYWILMLTAVASAGVNIGVMSKRFSGGN